MIDANVIGSGPWLGIAVDATDIAMPGQDDETAPLREPATGGRCRAMPQDRVATTWSRV
jgi:hypothetical protein